MTSRNLDALIETGQLKAEPADQAEFAGLVKSGRARLMDARNGDLSTESRFDLAYNAAHALSLAALRYNGYRSENRYLVFQCLPHTLGVEAKTWRVLAHCHSIRNRGEYEGLMDVSEQLVADLITATEIVMEKVKDLGKVE